MRTDIETRLRKLSETDTKGR